MNKKTNNIFLKSALEQIPRLLGQLNRNPSSRNYGSFDRAYWHYRTNDISCARYQEAVLTLTLLYSNDFEGNIYYQDVQVLKWINGSLKFTVSIQNKDGSFDEWYLNEESFVATSFVIAALSRTVDILGRDRIENYTAVINMLKSGGDWLMRRQETLVLNQFSGGVFALEYVYLLTKEIKYRELVKRKIQTILSHQNPEGWWSEYGGPDVGYLSLMIDYLAKYHRISRDESVLPAIGKANKFLLNFLHPNLTAGGEYMARNTEYLIPSGFAFLSSMDENADIISQFTASALFENRGINPNNLDDRYLCYILYNWIEAGLSFKKDGYLEKTKKYLRDRKLDIFFAQSGIKIFQNENYYFITNLKKGGSFRIYRYNKYYIDSGIEILSYGNSYISGVLNPYATIEASGNTLKVKSVLEKVKEPLMKTSTMIAFKSFQMTVGRLNIFQKSLKAFLRRKMITYNKDNKNTFTRVFEYSDNSIIVKDTLNMLVSRENILVGTKSSYNFIPSSKYFSVQGSGAERISSQEDYLQENSTTSIIRAFNFNK